MHLVMISQYIHPDLGTCYGGEDFMRIIKKLVANSHAGTPSRRVVSKVMSKYVRALSIQFQAQPFYA